jgi:hypothetical protein
MSAGFTAHPVSLDHRGVYKAFRKRRGITVFTSIVSIMALAALVGFAMPGSKGRVAVARETADVDAIEQVSATLSLAHIDHRATDAPHRHWISEVSHIAPIMRGGRLPDGLAIVAGKIEDRRGHRYTLTAETLNSPALLTRDP